MSKLINNSIELTKLTSAVHVTAKGTKCILIPIEQKGINLTEKGQVYLNFNTWVHDEADQYGCICANQLQSSKEEIASGTKGIYIGNGKAVEMKKTETTSAPKQPESLTNSNFDESNLPF